mgnify:CR=1 FL=1
MNANDVKNIFKAYHDIVAKLPTLYPANNEYIEKRTDSLLDVIINELDYDALVTTSWARSWREIKEFSDPRMWEELKTPFMRTLREFLCTPGAGILVAGPLGFKAFSARNNPVTMFSMLTDEGEYLYWTPVTLRNNVNNNAEHLLKIADSENPREVDVRKGEIAPDDLEKIAIDVISSMASRFVREYMARVKQYNNELNERDERKNYN